MKIDQEYLKGLLQACQPSETPTFNIIDLKAAGFDYEDPKFEFHIAILCDRHHHPQDSLAQASGRLRQEEDLRSPGPIGLRRQSHLDV